MNSTIYLKLITRYLSRLAEEISIGNDLNLHDDAVIAEEFFCRFLNKLLDLSLENLNDTNPNTDTIDLADKGRGICIQVTSNKKHSDKKTTTIASFIDKGYSKDYKSLVILFISNNVKSIHLEKRTYPDGWEYEGYDIRKLIGLIKGKCSAGELSALLDLLRSELDPLAVGKPAKEYLRLSRPWFRRGLEFLFPRIHYFLNRSSRHFPEPPEFQLLQSYIDGQRSEWKRDLEVKAYLSPFARELDLTPAQEQRRGKGFLLPAQQFIREIAGGSFGGDGSTAQINAMSRRSKRVKDLGRRLIRSKEPLIILGEPGSGKSLTLKRTALELCLVNEKRVYPNICIFISLGTWRIDSRPNQEDVERLVEKHLPEHLRPLKNDLIKQGRLVILFDGMDEMSRIDYVERTRALSAYAEANKRDIRMLFSCRIADFSPAFYHRKLVLLPFGPKQIQLYLFNHFKDDPILIKNPDTDEPETLSAIQVAGRLVDADLPLNVDNPFYLSMFCIHIRDKGEWPTSTTEILRSSVDRKYASKAKDAKDRGEVLPDQKEVFLSLGKLAFEITRRNKGTDASFEVLQGLYGTEASNILNIGTKCGILEQTTQVTTDDPILCRFTHHREQEFFTAWHLMYSDEFIDWSDYLDIPRWQETLVILSQMKGGTVPVEILSKGLESAIDEITDITDKDKSAISPGNKYEQVLREAVLSERVEFYSRVAKLTKRSPDNEPFHDQFYHPLKKVVLLLGERGNPITQVKMLNVIQSLKDAEFKGLVSGLRASSIDYVSENAEVVAAGLDGRLKTDAYPEGIIAAFSKGSIIPSLPWRLRQARRNQSAKTWMMNIVAAVLFVLQTFTIAAFFPVAAKLTNKPVATFVRAAFESENTRHPEVWILGMPDRNRDLTEKIDRIQNIWHWQPLVLTGMIVLVITARLLVNAGEAWNDGLEVGAFFSLISLGVYILWVFAEQMSYNTVIPLLILSFIGLYLIAGTLLILGFAWAMLVELIYMSLLAISICLWTRQPGYFFKTYMYTLEQSNLSEYEKKAGMFSGPLEAFGLTLWLAFLYFVTHSSTYRSVSSKAFHLPLAVPMVNIVVSILILIAATVSPIGFLYKDKKTKRNFFIADLVVVGVGLFIYILNLIGLGLGKILDYLLDTIPHRSATTPVKILGILLLSAFGLFCFLQLYELLKKLILRILLPKTLPSTKAAFIKAIRNKSAYTQSFILQNSSSTALEIKVPAFYELLIEIEPLIKKSAKSKYYEKMAQTRQLMRQSGEE